MSDVRCAPDHGGHRHAHSLLRRVALAALGLWTTGAIFPVLAPAQAGTVPLEQKTRGIDHQNRLLVIRALVTGKTHGIVLVAATQGTTSDVARQVTVLGGAVLAEFDDVGYLRTLIPLESLARLRALPEVVEAHIDIGNLSYGYDQGTDPSVLKGWNRGANLRDSAADALRPPVPGVARAAQNPYIPMGNMGTPQFTAAQPTYDGRGVTIGVLEQGTLDFTHPALQVAKSLSGDSIPKIRGVITPSAFDMAEHDTTLLWSHPMPDRRHVRLTDSVDASAQSTFHASGKLYTVPAPGHYAFGTYTSAAQLSYGVLWDSVRGLVWIDANRDGDFGNDEPLRDINTTFSAGYLRSDSSAARPQSSVSCAVAFDSAGGGLFVYEGTQAHQTMVASVAAGVQLVGGAANASAPAAQLVIVDAGWSLGDELEGFIRAERDPRIDLVSWSQTGEGFPATGESIVAIILHRTIERYGKPTFIAADNGGSLVMTVGEPSNTTGAISVGAYVHRDTYMAHLGWDVPDEDWLAGYSSRGPTLDGALKPDLVAPALSIAAQPCSMPREYIGPTAYYLPRCYMLGGGTSSAAPHAAGAAAVLISAAKQAGLPYDATHISWALTTGARYLPTYGAHEQGSGLVDVRQAWALLRRPVSLPTIVTVAPVNTVMNRYLRVPGRGRGIFEREGWRAGQHGMRTITLLRLAGGGETYGLRLLGNDGTFSTPVRQITLPLGAAVQVPVRIAVKTPGVHSVILELMEPTTGIAVHRMLATIVAAESFTAANHYTIRHPMQLPWLKSKSVFVRVPPGAGAMRVDLHVKRGKVRLRTEDGANTNLLDWSQYFKQYLFPFQARQYVVTGQRATELFPAPMPGVWEVIVEPFDLIEMADSAQYHVPSDVDVVVTLFKASGMSRGTAPDPSVSFANHMAPLAAARMTAELGTRRIVTGVVDSTIGPLVYPLTVDSGTTSLRVQVTPTADTTADLDLYLYDCTGGPCYLWDLNRRLSATKALLVRAPRAGRWKVVVDPARVSTSQTPFTYTEIVTGPQYGTVSVSKAASPSRLEGTWTARVVRRGSAASLQRRERVMIADLIDSGAEEEERAHPAAKFLAAPYRPVVIATVVTPIASR